MRINQFVRGLKIERGLTDAEACILSTITRLARSPAGGTRDPTLEELENALGKHATRQDIIRLMEKGGILLEFPRWSVSDETLKRA